MDTLAWLAEALAEFRTPEPAPEATLFLAGAFASDFGGDPLVHDLAQAITLRTGGRATLVVEDPATFPALVRGPAAYLRITREQRVILHPSDVPLTWEP